MYSASRWLTKLKHVADDKWLTELCLDLLYTVLLILLSYLHLSPHSFLLSSVPALSSSPSFHSHDSTVTIATALHAGLSWFWKPVRSTDFSLLPKHPDQLWGPSIFLFNGFQDSFLRLSGRHTQLAAHLYLVSRLRMSRAVPLLPLFTFMVWMVKPFNSLGNWPTWCTNSLCVYFYL